MTNDFFSRNWQHIGGWFLLLYLIVTLATLCWVLHTKRETMSAIAWSLTVLLLPLFGAVLFFLFGYQSVTRPLGRKKRRKEKFKKLDHKPGGEPIADVPPHWEAVAKLAYNNGEGERVQGGNLVTLYHDGRPAYDAMIEAIRAATHHVHIQFFIFRTDKSGQRFIDALCEKARTGVEVRFVYDSVGCFDLASRLLRQLRDAGGKAASFLPIFNPFYRMRVNLRNHRKILVVDGRVAFTGGLNIGDEYLGLNPKFGHWRDTFVRVEGPAASGLQRVFLEDWDFAANESLTAGKYYPGFDGGKPGKSLVQVVSSGPDSDYKAIRETYFAGILNARKRVWIASPYFVPDAGLKDAMVLAARSGIDVRFLGLFRPDKWIAFLAARFYWSDVLAAGVKVYQYAPGMMHSKYVLVDGEWASVGSANMDNRSLALNFEANVQLFDPELVAEMEAAYLKDLEASVRLDPEVFAARPVVSRLAENAARLLSPIL